MANLTSRVGRLISGGLNAAVDAVENASPLMVMEQSIREVEEAISEVRTEHGRATADRHLASKKLAENSSKHEEFAQSIKVAIENNRDDLAEAAIARQMDLEAQIPVLEQTVADAAEREKELNGYVDALKAKRGEMQDEMRTYKIRMAEQPENTVIDAGGNPSAAHSVNRKLDDASAAFDRASGHVSDMLGASSTDVAQMAELKELSKKTEIEKRLAALKEKSA
jgi:phage shock protein A